MQMFVGRALFFQAKRGIFPRRSLPFLIPFGIFRLTCGINSFILLAEYQLEKRAPARERLGIDHVRNSRLHGLQ